VAVPRVQPSHDSAAATGLLLSHIAETGATLSALVASLPKLTMLKETMAIEPNVIYSALQEFRDAVQDEAGAAIDPSDGVKVTFADGWVHARASNTESMIRLIVESDTEARATELLDWGRERLRR
jgi:phosphomannomutase